QDMYEAAIVTDSKADLIPGFKGIMEPGPKCPTLPLAELDFVLVPGLGFDATGARLGRGKGYYDRILAGVRGKRCGVAMDWQVVESIPASAHDMKVDFILTPTRWIQCVG
ncbi:MAG: 5-formyltetrahydrofolate cyclo-ligase, partial [Verrucomicrobiota bacterium]|nr:5-formyltetrahydrofolate cyclo-ligase [Verrucomicrobiota bacterium]